MYKQDPYFKQYLEEPTRDIRVEPPAPLPFEDHEPRQACSLCKRMSTPVYRAYECNFCQGCWRFTAWPRWTRDGQVTIVRCFHCGVQTAVRRVTARLPIATCGNWGCMLAWRAALIRAQRPPAKPAEQRTCLRCGTAFVTRRKQYCTDACRQAAYRERSAAAHKA
jgi:hypothetical protein